MQEEQVEKNKRLQPPKDLTENAGQKAVLAELNDEFILNNDAIEKLALTRAQIKVNRNELDLEMTKAATALISKEQAGLMGCFEMGTAENQINAYVHPQQQFASTLFETVNRNSHLDIVTKVSFVQQFLTRLKNRCTEVETLTSGPGVVFSLKDFNDCLQTLCRGLIKYGETALRSQSETASMKEQHLQHLVYVRERQAKYYQRKNEQFVNDIDTIINSKMTEKGNQMIYELDTSNRQLRMLKDNFYLMEKMMREEIHIDYSDQLIQKENLIKKYRESFKNYRTELNEEIKIEIDTEVATIDQNLKVKAQEYKMNRATKKKESVKKSEARKEEMPHLQRRHPMVINGLEVEPEHDDHGCVYYPTAREEIAILH